jgi:hypothetical protein
MVSRERLDVNWSVERVEMAEMPSTWASAHSHSHHGQHGEAILDDEIPVPDTAKLLAR